MKIAVTGHRPRSLGWGYDYNHPKYYELGRKLRDVLKENKATHAISGMALGVDTVFAMVVLKLRNTGILDVKLECAIPCSNQSSRWLENSVKLYNKILGEADKVTFVSKTVYTPQCMQRRNEYMVNNCDLLIAVWNGSPGGTKNCVDYAKKLNKKIIYINPKEC